MSNILEAFPDGIRDTITSSLTKALHSDDRSDEQIMKALQSPGPVTSQKNVWAFWGTGFGQMRPWNQRNVINWVRLLGPQWSVRVLDTVASSESNIKEFLDSKHLPQCLLRNEMTGAHSWQHAADMVRLACLFEYGGVWLDVGIILLMHLDQVCWTAISNPASKVELVMASGDASMMSGLVANFFIACKKGNTFIRRWMRIFFEVWKDRTTCRDIHLHPLFRSLLASGNIVRDFQLASPDKLDYFGMQLAYERLRLLQDPEDGFNGPNYCKNRILLLEYKEFASAAMLTQDDGFRQYKYLSTHYNEPEDSEAFAESWTFCRHLILNCAMLKLFHWNDNYFGRDVPTLADVWDRPEYQDADRQSGTLAEVLRYTSSHFTQTREPARGKFPPLAEESLVAGYLEA